jgi:hypothetical protein
MEEWEFYDEEGQIYTHRICLYICEPRYINNWIYFFCVATGSRKLVRVDQLFYVQLYGFSDCFTEAVFFIKNWRKKFTKAFQQISWK